MYLNNKHYEWRDKALDEEREAILQWLLDRMKALDRGIEYSAYDILNITIVFIQNR